MTTAEEVKRVREERGVGLLEAKTIVRRREKLTRLRNLRDKAYGSDDVLYKLIELLIEEEEGA